MFFACSKSEEPDSGGNSGNKPEKKIVYVGVNLSGAEFGGIYPGKMELIMDIRQKKILIILKQKDFI